MHFPFVIPILIAIIIPIITISIPIYELWPQFYFEIGQTTQTLENKKWTKLANKRGAKFLYILVHLNPDV